MSVPDSKVSQPATPVSAPSGGTHPWRIRLPIGLLVLAGAILSLTLFFLVRNSDQRRLHAEFERHADVPATAVQRQLDDHISLLRSIEAFFFSSRSVDRKEFGGFTRESLTRLRGILALEGIPRVSNG